MTNEQLNAIKVIKCLYNDLRDATDPDAVAARDSVEHPEYNLGSLCALHDVVGLLNVMRPYLDKL